MVEFRVIVGDGKPWRPNLATDGGDAWRALFQASAQRRQQEYARIDASCDRIEARLQAMLDHLDGRRPLKGRPISAERNAHIRAITHEAAHRQRWLEAEPEPALPDVPLHQRGFGVMDDPP